MTVPSQENQAPSNDKELNFRALESKYQRELQQERNARLEAEKQLAASHQKQMVVDEEDDPEPYIDHKRLKKEQAKFGQQMKQETQSEIHKAVQVAIQQERQQNWLKSNTDFDEVMKHGDKFYAHDPELAETILSMPEGFERTKLVYKNIKALGLHQEKPKESSIQQKIDSNRRDAGRYQPSSVSTSPYAGQQSDFSPTGQKAAYDKMQELKNRLRI